MAAAQIIATRDPLARLAETAQRDDAPATTGVTAAVLVADVSGFTALTASLEARHGARSADLLSVIMDRLLGTLGAIAETHGGRVIDVIGDAIHVLWIADDAKRLGDAERAAAEAALAMLGAAASAGDNEHETPVRIGIAGGEVQLAMVGGHAGRWDMLALGPTLRDAIAACTDAPRSTCLIKVALPADQLPGQIEAADDGWVMRHDGVRQGSPIRDSVEALAWDAELRLLTVIFCRLVDAAELGNADIGHVHALARAAQSIVSHHGGMVDRIHADEKGLSVVAAFGMQRGSAPGVPIDRVLGGGSPLHAALAAFDLKAALAERGTSSAIGIATGKVRVGVGDPHDGSGYTMYGAAMNLAARLMQASRDEILCDAATHAETLADLDFGDAGPRTLKGIGKGKRIFTVQGARRNRHAGAALDGNVLAGRHAERAAIIGFLAATTADAPSTMILDGAHGSGKSRLSAFAAAEAARHGFAPLVLRAGLLGRSTPLFAWRDPLAALLSQRAEARGQSVAELQAALVQQAGGGIDDIDAVATLFGADTGRADDADTDPATARRLRVGVAALLIGDRRHLIIVEDAHWLDDTSLVLARDLKRASAQHRFLFAAHAPAPDHLARGHGTVTRVTIGPLDREEAAELAASLLGPFDPKHPFVDWLQARSAGNPMFARSLIALLPPDIADTALKTPGAWRKVQAELERSDMPATIEGAILARFGNLPPSQLGLLKAASVIGDAFDAAALAALGTPSSAAQIARDLDSMVAADILIADGAEWRFADELTRSVVYDSIPRQLQRELHRRAATHAVSLASHDAAQVAHHWLEAELPERAFTPLRRAGLEAKRAGAYGTAVALWKAALDLLDSGKLGPERTGKLRRATLHRDLAFASWRLGEPAQTIDHCYASLDGLWAGAPTTKAGWATMLARQTLGLAWQVVRPGRSTRKRSREDRARDSLRLNNGVRLIEAFYFSQGALPAAAIATYGARIAERTGELAYGARPYGFLGYLAGSHGWHRVARFCFARPRRDCLTKRDWPSLSQSIHGETMYLLTQGRWADAIDRARFGRTLARKINKGADAGSITTLIGLGQLMAGDFAAMRVSFETVEAIAYAKANDHYLLFAREAIGQIELVAGSPQKAESLLVQAASLAKSVRDLQSALIAEGLLANTLVRLGKLDEALAMMPPLLDRAEATPMVNFGTWYGFGAVAEAATGLYAAFGPGERGIHRTSALRAMSALARFARSYPVAAPRARLVSGQIYALTNDHAAAVKRWERGLRAAEATGMRHDLARLHHALARAPGISEEAARHHGEQAAAFTALCGVRELPPLPIRFATKP